MTSICQWFFMLLFSKYSAFTINYSMERVKGIESRVDMLSKLRRSDLADIFGQISSINNKLSYLSRTKETHHKDEKMSEIDELDLRKTIDYIVKGVAAEKLEHAKSRELLMSMMNSLTFNNSNRIELLQTLVDELESKNFTLVNTEVLNAELKREKERMAIQIENLETKLTLQMEKLEEQMISKINNLTVDGCLLKERITKELGNGREQTLVTTTDALTTSDTKTASSCKDISLLNQRDGVYHLSNGIKVYCDQTNDGGGWTVFQRRKDGSVNFERKWIDYKTGFGELNGEFWLGNDNLHALTATGNHELRIDMEDFDGKKAYAKYDTFKIKSETENYILEVDGYSGNAGDSLKYHNEVKFSTEDRDSDNCAKYHKGGWWYKQCYESNLNGFYYNVDNVSYGEGISWYHWRGYGYSLKFVEMKLR